MQDRRWRATSQPGVFEDLPQLALTAQQLMQARIREYLT